MGTAAGSEQPGGRLRAPGTRDWGGGEERRGGGGFGGGRNVGEMPPALGDQGLRRPSEYEGAVAG